MAHVRKQLRDWLKANLAGSTEAGGRVHVRRSLPEPKDLQPTFQVAVQSERSRDVSMDGGQAREVLVRITALCKGDSEAGEDTLDAMCVFAEEKLAADPTLGGVAQTYEYQATEFAFSGEGEKTLCSAAMTFAVAVYTGRDDPETAS